MIIRTATPADFPSMARTAVSAFANDPMEEYLYPHRHKHPTAFLAHYISRFRDFSAHDDCYLIVAEPETSDAVWKGSSDVIGFAQWYERIDDSEEKEKKEKSFWRRFTEGISYRTSHIYALFSPYSSFSRSPTLDDSPSSVHLFSPTYQEPPISWSILDIAVDPLYQKHGVGMKLLEWGMGRAKQADLPVVLKATKAGQRMYEKAGFVGYGTWTWGKGEDGRFLLMRWDPPLISS